MIVLVKDNNGSDKAVDFSSVGWTTKAVNGNDSAIEIILDSGEQITMSTEQYNNMLNNLIESGSVIDFRKNQY